ncbi:MAG: hypothetical protein HY537_03850 [Deltaproteobacteria bacterium]|nr:hypothetical protein [Deltaproteobacteria bacterium]
MAFQVLEADNFIADLEEAALWLYSHNLEQSRQFADRKFIELEQEINELKSHLQEMPRMGQADEITGLRSFPVYEGRYLVTWIIDDEASTVILLEFIDLKYPKKLRGFTFEE